MIATSDTVQSEPHSHTAYVNFEPSQQTVMEQTKRFSYRQSQKKYMKIVKKLLISNLLISMNVNIQL